MSLLEIQHVSRRFDDFVALDDVSLTINAGEFFTLLGPSGCGKTTLLRMIAGFDQPDSGDILLDGKSLVQIPAEKRPIHTVFQSYALFPHMTVEQNIAFPLRMSGVDPAEIRKKVHNALDMVHLSRKGKSYPHELSGGQRQRVALARGLVNLPRLLLLDEPLGALDAKLRERMQIELIEIQRDVGITFIFVTHSQAEALALSHRVAVMDAGKVQQCGSPEAVYSFPHNRFVADFIGNVNMIDVKVISQENGTILLETESGGQITLSRSGLQEPVEVGESAVFLIRPEQVQIKPFTGELDTVNCFAGKVYDYLYIGDVTTYIVETKSGIRIEALLPNSASGVAKFFELGDEVIVSWNKDAGRLIYD